MSFAGFDVAEKAPPAQQNRKTQLRGQKLKGKGLNRHDVDPASSMMPENTPAPITSQDIQRAKRKQQRLQPRTPSIDSPIKHEKPVLPTDKNDQPPEQPNVTETENSPSVKMNFSEVKLKQRELQDQNILRRRALGKEVETRTKNIIAEANKLKRIEDEIKKLDQLLSYDVSVLRDKIDVASYEYSKAKTRLNLAEKEYNESKEDHDVKDKAKDLLVQDLMQLIQENEERKKTVLEKLVAKLNMTVDELAVKEEEEAAEAKMEEEKRIREAEEKRKADEESKRAEDEKVKLEEANKAEDGDGEQGDDSVEGNKDSPTQDAS